GVPLTDFMTGAPKTPAQLEADLTTHLGLLSTTGKTDLVKSINKNFGGRTDTVAKHTGLHETVRDSRLSNRRLEDDAKTDTTPVPGMRDTAQSQVGGARVAGVQAADELQAKNPTNITSAEAGTLQGFGVATRGELADMDSDKKKRIVDSGAITQPRLDELQAGAKKSIERPVTSEEQWRMDSGVSKEDLSKQKSYAQVFKDQISNSRPRGQPNREDFLTFAEQQEQGA
ncbi:MAG: hypothetical protein V1703_02130, partial [Candidatus Altiarchaeota archaeon]